MNATADNFREAWNITKVFLDDTGESCLMLSVNTEPTVSNYIIIKLPFGKNTFLLYSPQLSSMCPTPGINLDYAGFYNRATKKTYDIHEPLTRFFGFDGEIIYKDSLKRMVKEAIQVAVAEHIANHTEEYSGFSVVTCNQDVKDTAEKAFSLKESNLNFAKRIPVDDWAIFDSTMAEYIDDPETFLKKRVEERIKGRTEELARLWAAHCASQQILDRLIVEYERGGSDE